jgi:membrane-associated phospholipid phosphatase
VSGPDARARTILIGVVVAYVAAYAVATLIGSPVLTYVARKSILLPALSLYALRQPEVERFVRDWFPFIAATLLFDALRGAIYPLVEAGHRPVFAEYPIAFEQWLVGTPAASLQLQAWFRSVWLDRMAVGIHGAHFVVFLLFGLAIWHRHRSFFARYKWSMVTVYYGGLLGYYLVPTVPPWMASSALDLLPPVARVADDVYRWVPELYRTFDTNPVAAMPSLHAAFPAVLAIVAWRVLSRRWAWGVTIYFVLVNLAVVYLGDHYIVDLIAGWVLAMAACIAVFRIRPSGEPASLTTAVATAAVVMAIALGVAASTAY